MADEALEHQFQLQNSRLARLWLIASHVLLLLLMLLTPWPQAALFLLPVPYLWLRHRQLRVAGQVHCSGQYWQFTDQLPKQIKRIQCQPWGVRLTFSGLWFNQRYIWRDQLSKKDWSQLCSFAKTKAWK